MPRARILQDHPTFLNNGLNVRGNMTPPKLPPSMTMPVASPRFSLNQWLRTLIAIVLDMPQPVPATLPYASMKCQNLVLSVIAKIPAM